MSATIRSERREARELPRGNMPVRVARYVLSRTAPSVRCDCGGTAYALVFDGPRPRWVCGGSKCH